MHVYLRVILFVLLASLGTAQTRIVLGGTDYSTNPDPIVWLDGASGNLTASVRDPDGGGRLVAPKATSGNVPWNAALAYTSRFTSNYSTGVSRFSNGLVDHMAAQIWYADNSQTTYLAMAKELINRFNEVMVSWQCDETA